MFDFGLCPRCQNEISQERQSDQVLVCDHCGWTPQTSNERMAKKISRRSLFAMLGLSVLVSSLYIHSLYWGKYSLEILPLKWKEYTQSATDIDYKKNGRYLQRALSFFMF